MSNVREEPCGCIVQTVTEWGEIVLKFCADHLISADPYGVIPRRRPGR